MKSRIAVSENPEYNIYFATEPKYFEILDNNPYIHKVIPYNQQMDNLLLMEGQGEHEGFFEITFLPYIGTQRIFNYQDLKFFAD